MFYLGFYAVPLFIVITFYFNAKYYLNEKPPLVIVLNKLKRLYSPLIFWSFIGFLLTPSQISPSHILRQLIFGTVVDVPLYYLNMLIVFTIIWYLIRSRRIIFLFFIFFLILEAASLNKILIAAAPFKIQFFLIRFIEFFKYAAVGSFLPTLSTYSKRISYSKPLIIALFLTTTITDITNQVPLQNDVIIYSGLLQFLAVSSLILFISLYEEINFSKPLVNIIGFLSKYALGLYCLHFLFIEKLPALPIPLIIIVCYLISFALDKISRSRLKSVVS